MNDWKKRVVHALKVAIITAFLVFAGILAPFAFVTTPMTDAQIDRIYELAGWWAFASFGFQCVRVLISKKSQT